MEALSSPGVAGEVVGGSHAPVATETEEQEGRGSDREGKVGRLGRVCWARPSGSRGFLFLLLLFFFHYLLAIKCILYNVGLGQINTLHLLALPQKVWEAFEFL